MEDSIAKVKVKVGSIELEYEGAASFLGDGLNDLLEHVAGISKTVPIVQANVATSEIAPIQQAAEAPTQKLNLSTASIAARLGVSTGPDLAICAMAHLELVKGATSYDRKTIVAEMRTAGSYFNASMSSNSSATMASLVKNKKANEVSTGKFCLHATERKRVESSLAGD